MFFQVEPFRRGRLRLDESSGEQCEACGADICEATVVGAGDLIHCEGCGMDYPAHIVER